MTPRSAMIAGHDCRHVGLAPAPRVNGVIAALLAALVAQQADEVRGNDAPSCDKAQYRQCAPKGCTPYRGKKHEWDCVEHATKPVGSYPAGHYGLFDMAGNGYEWTSSLGGSKAVLRGGSWYWPAAQIKGSYRRPERPDTGHHRLSARCASSTAAVR